MYTIKRVNPWKRNGIRKAVYVKSWAVFYFYYMSIWTGCCKVKQSVNIISSPQCLVLASNKCEISGCLSTTGFSLVKFENIALTIQLSSVTFKTVSKGSQYQSLLQSVTTTNGKNKSKSSELIYPDRKELSQGLRMLVQTPFWLTLVRSSVNQLEFRS